MGYQCTPHSLHQPLHHFLPNFQRSFLCCSTSAACPQVRLVLVHGAQSRWVPLAILTFYCLLDLTVQYACAWPLVQNALQQWGIFQGVPDYVPTLLGLEP